MEKIKVTAQLRQKAGVRGELSKLRATKQIPAVIYGAGKEPAAITVTEKDLLAIQKAGGNVIVAFIQKVTAAKAGEPGENQKSGDRRGSG